MNSPHLKLLDTLRQRRDGWLSADQLSGKLRFAPVQLRAAIRLLTDRGYEIEAHPQLGYRLIAEPERLIAKDLAPQHPIAGIGSRVLLEEVTESTMDSAWELATRGAPHGTTIFAEDQTRGRGRLGRTWTASPGRSLLFSVVLRPKDGSASPHLIVTAAAVALAKVVRRTANLPAQIEWPNDIILDGKKTGGLLLETRPALSPEVWILGVGLNVNQTLADFPPELVPSATSLRIAAGRPLDRTALAGAALDELGGWYEAFERKDLHLIESAWTELSYTLGRTVKIAEGETTYTGRVLGLSPLEGLLVQLTKGGLKTFPPERASLRLESD